MCSEAEFIMTSEHGQFVFVESLIHVVMLKSSLIK